MAGGKGKSIGGKGAPGKDAAGKTQKSHSAKAGLQVSYFCDLLVVDVPEYAFTLFTTPFAMLLLCDTNTVMKNMCKSCRVLRVEPSAPVVTTLFFVPLQNLSFGEFLLGLLSRVSVE